MSAQKTMDTNMIVGSLKIRLLVRESRTLKDKRQVVRSIKDRLRNAFNISIAEVDHLDKIQVAVLGIAMVSGETHHIKGEFGKILEALRSHPIAELIDHEMEI